MWVTPHTASSRPAYYAGVIHTSTSKNQKSAWFVTQNLCGEKLFPEVNEEFGALFGFALYIDLAAHGNDLCSDQV